MIARQRREVKSKETVNEATQVQQERRILACKKRCKHDDVEAENSRKEPTEPTSEMMWDAQRKGNHSCTMLHRKES